MSRKMKDSGIEWIGEIPEDWEIVKVKNIFNNHKNIVCEKENEYERLALTLNGVIKRSKEDSKGLQSESFSTYQVIYENDLVFKLIDLENVNTSRVGKSPYTGIVSPVYIILSNERESAFGYYYFLSLWHREIFNKLGGNGVRSALNLNDLNNLPYPQFDTRMKKYVAEYLDVRCSLIDQTIEKQKQVIEKLKEYKQSVITEVVTKGLNPNVAMKDSGIEWIGEIPEHWKRCKILFVLEMPITDGPHETPELVESGIPFISAEAIKKGKIDFDKKRGYITNDFYEECCKKYIPRLNDIYMIKSGATTGNVGIVETNDIFTIWSPLAVFRCNKEVYFKYLYYFLQSSIFQEQVKNKWSYGTQQNIGMRVLESLYLTFGDCNEQENIANYLDDKCIKIDNAISLKEEGIEKLESYKKSLIYECVTGKREVM